MTELGLFPLAELLHSLSTFVRLAAAGAILLILWGVALILGTLLSSTADRPERGAVR
jgi:hypothetical protein